MRLKRGVRGEAPLPGVHNLFLWEVTMGVNLACALFFGVLVTAERPKADPAKEEIKRLDGVWVPVSAESAAGKFSDKQDLDDLGKFIIKDGKTLMKDGNKLLQAVIKVDPTKKPKTMDIVVDEGKDKGWAQLLIYEVDGETLRVCYDVGQISTRRPTEFSTRNDQLIIVHKREKP
jgi:uncharacterized protein (TIGR03067 family)